MVSVVSIDCVVFNGKCAEYVFPFTMRYKHQPHGKDACGWNMCWQPMKRIHTNSHLRVKLYKTKRILAESPAIDLANTCECVAAGCAS